MTDNPTVNRYLKDKEFDRMDHALGRPMWPLRETYRNYFATGASGELAAALDRSPWWAKTGQTGDMAYFHVTDAGVAALVDHLAIHDLHHAFEVTWDGHAEIIPAPTAAKAKYEYFLHAKDVIPDLRFIDFSRSVRARRAA